MRQLLMILEYPDPELTSEVVRLRKWSYDDLACVEQASTDPDIPKGTTVPAVYTEAEGRAFIERCWSRRVNSEGLVLAIADAASNKALGLVFLGFSRIRGELRLGYWLVPGARGAGYGTDAVRLASRWALTKTDFHRIVARVKPDNAASLALLHKCGFAEEGLLREWLWIDEERHDAVQFSLLASDIDDLRI